MARAVRSGSRADTAILVACAALSLLLTFLPTGLRETMAAALRQTVLAPVIALQARVERTRIAFLTRDATTARIDSLVLRVAALESLESENVRLRRLLGLARSLRWGFVPAEALRGRGLGDEHSIIITAGASSGIVADSSGVIAPAGLVGRIATVDPNTSTAILWTHPNFRVSAIAGDGTVFGIVAPHQGDEADRYLLELRGVAYRDTLAPGTPVRSSGMGGVFPRGILIGTVLGELEGAQGWSRTYLVRPAVVPSDVSEVMVLLPSRVSTDLASVWASPRADSAAAAVVRAGDSLAALARQDSLRRLPVAVDSARRDTLARAPVPPGPGTERR
ncbi:MAG TPA: rod shape-determining protein MreC [Gemmatimonadaceae bacterium]|nr:rod shape-determining protein MreC [Gemmatimonadaceae bacterium]